MKNKEPKSGNSGVKSDKEKTLKKHSTVALLALAWLVGCNGQDSEPNTQQAEVIKEQKPLTVEERIAEKKRPAMGRRPRVHHRA
ncbi:hypothetical protein [Vibrio mexicanus]|uniref:hypothetical protein n=1 Tax=Vibrio mexicanus TaxID=1004326 RepID=UPI003B503A32